MTDEACIFHKFGYCKFKLHCKRKHYTEVCHENETCDANKSCKKRHPKKCKNNETERGCRFGAECCYLHDSQKSANKVPETKSMSRLQEKINQLEKSVSDLTKKVVSLKDKKVEQLDKVVRALTRKVLSLESEIEVLKRNSTLSEGL